MRARTRKNTLYTARIFKHLIATLGEQFPARELSQADL
jgi:hypothetical protein